MRHGGRRRGRPRFLLRGEPFHGAGGPYGWDGLRFAALLGRLHALARELVEAPAVHSGIEHFQGSAASVDLVVMGEIGEAFENPKQLLVPRAAPDLYITGAALRTEPSEPGELVATLRGRRHGEAAERAHEMERLALAGLPRILAEPDADPVAVLLGGIKEQTLDVARIGSHSHHIQQVVAARLVAAELDADRPIGIVALC